MRGATYDPSPFFWFYYISTHAPLAGRDGRARWYTIPKSVFQPTRPLRGATRSTTSGSAHPSYFNPRAPCGARRSCAACGRISSVFQPTRPLRGATFKGEVILRHVEFQPTRPLRGATASVDSGPSFASEFQPTRPLRGATGELHDVLERAREFQPTRPLRGATDESPRLIQRHFLFQPTRPLRGATATMIEGSSIL